MRKSESAALLKELDGADGELKRLKSDSCSDLVMDDLERKELDLRRRNEEIDAKTNREVDLKSSAVPALQGGPSGYTQPFIDIKLRELPFSVQLAWQSVCVTLQRCQACWETSQISGMCQHSCQLLI